jgi:hypothetical protein
VNSDVIFGEIVVHEMAVALVDDNILQCSSKGSSITTPL